MSLPKRKILICGNYGINNLGDEAILKGIIEIVRSAFPDAVITVLSSNPKNTAHKYNVSSIYFWPSGIRSLFKFIFRGRFLSTLKSYWQTDLFILGGGGLFTDEKARAILIWLIQSLPAILLRKKIFCLGQSVGPLRTKWSQKITHFIFKKALVITVRDSESANLLEQLGLKNIKVLADPAFAVGYTQGNFYEQKPFIVLSLRPWIQGDHEKIEQELVKFIGWLYEKHNLLTLFIPFQIDQENDLKRYENLKKVLENYSGSSGNILEFFNDYNDFEKVLSAISSSQYVLGMRLHSIIFSVIGKVPFLGLSYSQKVKNFIKQLGFDKTIEENLFFPYENINFEQLKTVFSAIQNHRTKIIHQLEKAKLKSTYATFDHVKLLQSLFADSNC